MNAFTGLINFKSGRANRIGLELEMTALESCDIIVKGSESAIHPGAYVRDS